MRKEGAQAVIVNQENKVLLLKTPNDTWTFAQGGIEDGESKEDAVIREVEEETGIKENMITSYQRVPVEDRFSMDGIECIFYPFLVVVESSNVTIDNNPSEEHDEFRWVSFDDAESLLKYDNQKDVLNEARRLYEERR